MDRRREERRPAATPTELGAEAAQAEATRTEAAAQLASFGGFAMLVQLGAEAVVVGLGDVAEIRMQPGDVDFTVDYVGAALTPQRLADTLVAAGVLGASASEPAAGARAEKRWVVARPPR